MTRAIGDHYTLVTNIWLSLQNSDIGEDEALAEVCSSRVAQTATKQSCEALAVYVKQIACRIDDEGKRFGFFLAAHVDSLLEADHGDKALILLEAISPMFDPQQEPGLQMRVTTARAMMATGAFEDASHELSSLRALYAARSDSDARSDCTVLSSQCLAEMALQSERIGNCGKAATEYIAAASLLADDGGYDARAGQFFMFAASMLLHERRFADALMNSVKADRLLSEASSQDRAQSWHNTATAQFHLGQYQAAVATYDSLIQLFNEEDDRRSEAVARHNRASVYVRLGRYQQAAREYALLEDEYANYLSLQERAYCKKGRGNMLQEFGQYADAIDCYNDAERLSDNPVFRAECQADRGGAYAALKDLSSAMHDWNQAKPVLKSAGLKEALFECIRNRALSMCRLERFEEAVVELSEVDIQSLNDDLVCRYYRMLLICLWDAGRKADALACIDQGLQALRKARAAAQIDETSIEFMTDRSELIVKGVHAALEMDQPVYALRILQDGKATVLRGWQSANLGEPGGTQLAEGRRRLGSWLHSGQHRERTRLVARRAQGSTNFGTETHKVGNDIESLLRRETEGRLKEYLREWRRTRLRESIAPPAFDLGVLQSALPADWAIIDFCVLNPGLVKAFIVTKGELTVASLKVDTRHDLLPVLEEVLRWSRLPSDKDEWACDLLYDIICEPLKPYLGGVKGIYLVPHNYIALLPLHAARSPSGRYFCEEYEIAYLPSADLLPQLSCVSNDGTMLTFANPDKHTPLTLPFAEIEAERIHSKLALSKHRLFIGSDATCDQTENWTTASVLHFACHGHAETQFAPLSYLRLADDVLLAHDVLYRCPSLRPGSSVFLNGCETSVTDNRAVDEALGIMSMFLSRGAAMVLATRWCVDDLCASEMMVSFAVAFLNERRTAVESLRRAQARARSITAEEVEDQCATLLRSRFSLQEDPHEVARVAGVATNACIASRNVQGARYFGRQAQMAFRRSDMPESALKYEAVAELTDADLGESLGSGPKTRVYDRPFYWSAFQLVGRVT